MAELTVKHGDDDMDAIFEQVMSCNPALPPDQLDEVANMVLDQALTGRPWRLAALLATKDGAFFKDLASNPESAQSLAPTVEILQAFAERMRGIAELAECAAARVMVAGCNHEQFNTWASEGA
jgi:hypothetical protein